MIRIPPTLSFPNILATFMPLLQSLITLIVLNACIPITSLWLTALGQRIRVPHHSRYLPAPWSPQQPAQSLHQLFFPVFPLAKDMGQIPLASESILPWTSQTFCWLQQIWLKHNCSCQPSCVPGLCRVAAKDRNKPFVYSGNWRAALTSG